MLAKLKKENLALAFIFRTVPVLVLSFIFLTIATNAQTVSSNASTTGNEEATQAATTETVKTPVLTPVLNNYRGITIGMAAKDVKEKLGKAEIADKDGFYYEISDDETAQIVLDAEQKVRVISVTYKVKNAPKFEEVLGADPSVEPNGAAYKLVRYPEAGYWVAYSRAAGDNAMVTVTIQKL